WGAGRSRCRAGDVTSGSNLSMKIASHRSQPLLSARHVISSIVCAPRLRVAAFVVATAGLALAGCGGGSAGSGGHATAQDLLALNHMQDASGIHTRELSVEE